MKLLKIAILVALLAFCTCQKLFNDDSASCKSTTDDKITLGGEGDTGLISKLNTFKKFGSNEAAYFFDHLDYLFQNKMVAKFKAIYEAALETKFEDSEDIYSEEILKKKVVQGREFSDEVGFEKYLAGFDKDAYKKSIRYPQVVKFMKTAKWYHQNLMNFEKVSFDKFDFNGNGRLDISEFILFSILHNMPIYGKGECVEEHCYDDIFKTLIDPIYNHANCEKSGYITSEDIWETLKKMNRPEGETHTHSLFSCNFKLDMIKEYRTISVNDFVLISDWDHHGHLNQNQFRAGILLGYWSRQVKKTQILDDDEKNGKRDRWNDAGTMDKMCEQIKKFLPRSSKNLQQSLGPDV